MKQVAERNGILFIHFEGDQWTSLLETRHGPREFTLARAHDIVDDLAVPTLCLIEGQSREDGQSLFIGCVSSKAAVTTFETRLKIRRTMQIRPPSLRQLTRSLVPELRRRVRALVKDRLVTVLHRGADEVINALFSIVSNRDAMQLVANSLSSPRSFEDVAAEQEDAVRTALKAFGITYDDEAASLQLVSGQDTALSRVAVMEDSVIEHDARYIPGFRLLRSDLTGRAVFEHGDEQLEVFTANRRPLEQLFGVDLIYHNIKRSNIIMLQYKMLERSENRRGESDWIYRPDDQLESELRRMRTFASRLLPMEDDYRLNSSVFYLKFVRRLSPMDSATLITPLEHFEMLQRDPSFRGPRNGVVVSYQSLSGHYMRQGAFLDLFRSGYIGAHSDSAAHFKCPRTNNASIEARRLISLHPTESDLPGKIIRERALTGAH